jgi:hypothetical protein
LRPDRGDDEIKIAKFPSDSEQRVNMNFSERDLAKPNIKQNNTNYEDKMDLVLEFLLALALLAKILFKI